MLFELFKSVENCISLSSTQDALDSLLCSAFFDPCVACNLFGAASLGVRKALSTMEEIDNRQVTLCNHQQETSIESSMGCCSVQRPGNLVPEFESSQSPAYMSSCRLLDQYNPILPSDSLQCT